MESSVLSSAWQILGTEAMLILVASAKHLYRVYPVRDRQMVSSLCTMRDYPAKLHYMIVSQMYIGHIVTLCTTACTTRNAWSQFS